MSKRGFSLALAILLSFLLPAASQASDPAPGRLPPDAPPYPGIYIQYDNPADNLDQDHGYPVVGGHTRYGWDMLEPDFDNDYRFDEVILPWVTEHANRGKMVGIAFSTYSGRQYGGITVPAWLWNRDAGVRLYNQGWYLLNYLNRTYVNEYAEFVHAFAAWAAANPVVRDHLAWIEIGTGLFGENQPTAKNYYDGADHTFYATQAPGGSLPSGWTAADWVAHVNEIVAAYRAAFDAAGLPGVPVLTNIAPTFRDPWEREAISNEAASIGAGLKHAGLLADHNNAENSYRPMRAWSEDPTTDVPITWETYGHPWGTAYVDWYWMVRCALAKHPDVFMITRDQVTDASYLPSTRVAADYSGVTRDTTPDVWVALRETFRTDTWDRPEHGNYEFWLRQVDDAMGHTVVETGRNDALTQGKTNRLGLPVYNPILGNHFESWTTRRTSQGDGNPYMWFDIDDAYLNGPYPVEIEVTYFDLGSDVWSVAYATPSGVRTAGPIQKTNTMTWLTATVSIADGLFDNSLGGSYDFRIDCRGDGDEWIHLVKVRRSESLIQHTPLSVAAEGLPLTIRASVSAAMSPPTVSLEYRRPGDENVSLLPMLAEGEAFAATIPGPSVTSAGLEYRISASGNGLTEAHPRTGFHAVSVSDLCTVQGEIPRQECRALVSLFDSTQGDMWHDQLRWKGDVHPCTWGGVTCSGGHVREIRLHGNNLQGELPSLLGALPQLSILDVSQNAIGGRLPAALGALGELRELDFGANRLTGWIPAAMGALSKLSLLDLHSNLLQGEIPPGLTALGSSISPGPPLVDLGYNRLRSADPAVLAFLAQAAPGWEATQTVPPEDIRVTARAATTISLAWTPIAYAQHGGHYQVRIATTPGGPYAVHGTTPDKTASGYTINGLSPEQSYYVVLRSYSPSHDDQQSNLWSEYGAEIEASTRVVWVSPDEIWVQPGTWQQITAVFRDPLGWDNVRYADVMVNRQADPAGGIAIRYDTQTGSAYLHHPSRPRWFAKNLIPGEPGGVRHFRGELDAAPSSVVTDANTITVTWAVKPTWRMSGASYHLYLRQVDVSGQSSGWEDHGDWTINRMPNFLIPPSLSRTSLQAGTRYTFDPRYRDLDGLTNLSECYFAFADSLPQADEGIQPDGVYLKYDESEGALYLGTRNGSFVGAKSATPRSLEVLENEYMRVIVRWSGPDVMDFRTRIVRWRIEFKDAYAGRHKMYMRAVDLLGPEFGGETGWKWKGWVEIR